MRPMASAGRRMRRSDSGSAAAARSYQMRARSPYRASNKRTGSVISPARRSSGVTPMRAKSSPARYTRPEAASSPTSRRMLVSCTAIPMLRAYSRAPGSPASSTRTSSRPTVEATR
jgi:hypothetical protein